MAENKDSLRQIIYRHETHRSEQEPLPHEWTFVIINQPQEIRRIEERIYDELRNSLPYGNGSVSEGLNTYNFEKAVPGESLNAKYLNFRSEASEIKRKRNIYDSKKFFKDRNLRRFTDIEFDNYIESFQKRNGVYAPNN